MKDEHSLCPTICEYLSTLDIDELKEVRGRIELLLSDKEVDRTKETIALDYIRDTLLNRGKVAHNTRADLRRHPDYEEFTSWMENIIEYIDHEFKPSRQAEWVKIFHLLLALEAKFLDDMNIPISFRSITRNLDKIPGLVRTAFPGYRENNFLPLLLKLHA
jgi:hypothetical protein